MYLQPYLIQWAPTYWHHDLDLSRSPDNTGHVSNRSATCQSYWNRVKGKADDFLYRGLCNSRIIAEPLYNTPLVHRTLCHCQQYRAFSMKALARYQIILLGEQRLGVNNLLRVVARIMPRSELNHLSKALPLHHWVTNHYCKTYINGDTSFLREPRITFWLFSGSPLEVRPPNRSSRIMAQTTWIHARMCLLQ